jgi:hypothetical protein
VNVDRRPDLVLAAAQDYEWKDVSGFVDSLLATGFEGEIRFFAPGVSDATARRLAAHGVHVIRPSRLRVKLGGRIFRPYNPRTTRLRWHIQPLYRHVVRALAALAPDRRAATARFAGALANIEVARYFWAYLFLSRTASRYRNVLLTDVRDVVFLRNPSEIDVGDSVWSFLENEQLTLADNVNNRGWLAGAFGDDALAELGDRPISCSGIILGEATGALRYLTVMVDALARLPRQFHGIDQGVHNYVIHKGLVPRARLVTNTDGPVLTVGLMSAEQATTLLRRREGEVSVVHQYDRHPELAQRLALRRVASL